MHSKRLEEVKPGEEKWKSGPLKYLFVAALAILVVVTLLLFELLGPAGLALGVVTMGVLTASFARFASRAYGTLPGEYVAICPHCRNHNHGRRNICEKCGAPLRILPQGGS